MSKLLDQFKAARRAATPLLCIRTPDPAATMRSIAVSFNGNPPPILHWDIVRGLRGYNKPGETVASDLAPNPNSTVGPVDCLIACQRAPEPAVIFMANAHRVISDQGVSQAIWNLRDQFKASRRTMVLLCPSIELPVEIQQDVVVLDEPMPTVDDLGKIVSDIYKSAEMKTPADLTPHTDALCGLAAFPAEECAAMSLTATGMDMEGLWERKRVAIEQTKGLSVYRGTEVFTDIGGCENGKRYMQMVIDAQDAARVFIFQDEVEKQFAGTGTDSSGVKTSLTGTILSWMQDNDVHGCLFVGHPGAAKSMLAKATGNTGRKPTIQFDLNAMESSLVGESGANLRAALKTIEAVGQGRYYFIATCNSMAGLPPELKRRYDDTTFFFDLPTAEERKAIWRIYFKKFGLAKQPLPIEEGWTGAEIRSCCSKAWRFRISVQEAAEYIVPISRSAADRIEKLRQEANGRYISASYSGTYQMHREATAVASGSRKLEV